MDRNTAITVTNTPIACGYGRMIMIFQIGHRPITSLGMISIDVLYHKLLGFAMENQFFVVITA